MKGLNYRQIETSREVRLWLKEIIVPAIAGMGMYLTLNPEAKAKIKAKFKKKEENKDNIIEF